MDTRNPLVQTSLGPRRVVTKAEAEAELFKELV